MGFWSRLTVLVLVLTVLTIPASVSAAQPPYLLKVEDEIKGATKQIPHLLKVEDELKSVKKMPRICACVGESLVHLEALPGGR
jgi:hypothetical protein